MISKPQTLIAANLNGVTVCDCIFMSCSFVLSCENRIYILSICQHLHNIIFIILSDVIIIVIVNSYNVIVIYIVCTG